MSAPRSERTDARLGTRLLALFVAAALLPVIVSDWLSLASAQRVARELGTEHRARQVRQASRQVFDRLVAGKTLLGSMLQTGTLGSGNGSSPSSVTVRGTRMFIAVAPANPEAGELFEMWTAAARRSTSRLHARTGPASELRTAVQSDGSTRILLGIGRTQQVEWLAEFEPQRLWAPLADAGDDGAWTVVDAHGVVLNRHRGDDFDPARVGDASSDAIDSSARLFMDAEFAAPDWIVSQRSPAPVVHWLGHPLDRWLALVAVLATLVAVLLARWQIGRALVPLRRLLTGTRRMAGGETGVQVALERRDELGALATSFNEMARRVDGQLAALRGLAGIDRAILAGAPIEEVATLVLTQLARAEPGWQASVVLRGAGGEWRHGRLALQGAGRPPRLIGLAPLEVPSAREQAAFDVALAPGPDMRDAPHRFSLPLPPDLGFVLPGPHSGSRVAVLLPLAPDGSDAALLALAAPAPGALDDTTVAGALALRDRLEVAFAARAREHALDWNAHHDSLTGLLNRLGLQQAIDACVVRPDPAFALLAIDLDNFKDVNDGHGHDAGDAVLRGVARRLSDCAGPGCSVARPGGDEFVILMPGADDIAARRLADRAVAALALPLSSGDVSHVLGASIGVAIAPAHGRNREELIRAADVALYAAKAAGRGRAAVFESALDRQARDRVRLVAELRDAITRREFVAYFQPRVRASDGVTTSAEALVRWRHPLRGLLPPGAFIEAAEHSGLIGEIGREMLDAACAQIATWRRAGALIERVSVNVSSRQLDDGSLPDVVRAALVRHGVPATALELEITESLLVGNAEATTVQLSALRALGVRIAIDDFGTGYSSLSALRTLPLDILKIDRAFVKDIGRGAGSEAIVHAIVTLARQLGLGLVAEGIETPEQAAALRALDCDELQGYLFGRPVPAGELDARLRPSLAAAPA